MHNDKNNKLNVRLLADRVWIKVEAKEANRKTASGIYIPDVVKGDGAVTDIAVVLKISAQVVKHNIDNPEERIEVGDRILLSSYAGSDLTYNDEDYKVVRIADIHSVIEEIEDNVA